MCRSSGVALYRYSDDEDDGIHTVYICHEFILVLLFLVITFVCITSVIALQSIRNTRPYVGEAPAPGEEDEDEEEKEEEEVKSKTDDHIVHPLIVLFNFAFILTTIMSPLGPVVIDYILRHHIPIIFTLVFIFFHILIVRLLWFIADRVDTCAIYNGAASEVLAVQQQKTLAAREVIQNYKDGLAERVSSTTVVDGEGGGVGQEDENDDESYFTEQEAREGEISTVSTLNRVH